MQITNMGSEYRRGLSGTGTLGLAGEASSASKPWSPSAEPFRGAVKRPEAPGTHFARKLAEKQTAPANSNTSSDESRGRPATSCQQLSTSPTSQEC